MTDNNPPERVPDASEPIKNPLSETEAREFIHKEVGRDLQRRAKWFFAIFGVVNLVALVGMWITVQNAAKDVATREASQSTHTTLDPILKIMTDTFMQAWQGYLKEYSDFEKRRLSVEQSVIGAEDGIKKLRESITTEEGNIKANEGNIKALSDSATNDNALLENIENMTRRIPELYKKLIAQEDLLKRFQKLPTTELASVAAQLNTQGQAILPKLDQMFTELKKQYTYDIITVDSDPTTARWSHSGLFRQALFYSMLPGATLLDNHSASEGKIELPKGSEVIAFWGVSTGSKPPPEYAIVRESDPNKISVLFPIKGSDQGNVTVYILYRTPIV